MPITGGNVSLYNETDGQAIYPTPVRHRRPDRGRGRVVGARVSGRRATSSSCSAIRGELGGSEYLKMVHGLSRAGRRRSISSASGRCRPARRLVARAAASSRRTTVPTAAWRSTLAECCVRQRRHRRGVDVDGGRRSADPAFDRPRDALRRIGVARRSVGRRRRARRALLARGRGRGRGGAGDRPDGGDRIADQRSAAGLVIDVRWATPRARGRRDRKMRRKPKPTESLRTTCSTSSKTNAASSASTATPKRPTSPISASTRCSTAARRAPASPRPTASASASSKAMGYVADIFDEATLAKLPGHRRDRPRALLDGRREQLSNAQPILIDCAHGQIALCHNGNLVNAASCASELVAPGLHLPDHQRHGSGPASLRAVEGADARRRARRGGFAGAGRVLARADDEGPA